MLFLIYTNDLPALIKKHATPVLFAHDTSILITHSNLTGFTENINMVLEALNNWFNKNFLSLNFEKTQFTHFTTNNNIHIILELIIRHSPLFHTPNF
jgi:hypothetical protein